LLTAPAPDASIFDEHLPPELRCATPRHQVACRRDADTRRHMRRFADVDTITPMMPRALTRRDFARHHTLMFFSQRRSFLPPTPIRATPAIFRHCFSRRRRR
jgi:hypothetical protein